MNRVTTFFRTVFNKDKAVLRTVSETVTAAFDAHQKAIDHFNKAIDAHNKAERHREVIRARQMRENRILSHGARQYRGPGL